MTLDRPLTFRPILKPRVWGGRFLSARVEDPPDGPIGESWEIADQDDVVSVTDEGDSLRELMHRHREALVGTAVDPASPEVFPLLLKLVDLEGSFSVQVHPDDASAGARRPGQLGKAEAWYVLEAGEGARIYHGVQPGTTRDEFARALGEGSAPARLRRLAARRGDVVHVPAGTIHASVGPLRLVEIQQTSDATYRLFDWEQAGLDGERRPLQVDDALDVARWDGDQGGLCRPEDTMLDAVLRRRHVASDKFVVDELVAEAGGSVILDTGRRRFDIFTVVEGRVDIRTGERTLGRGPLDSALVPAAAGRYEVALSPGARLLRFFRPK
jgi:mannose-6-phosphate isomerase